MNTIIFEVLKFYSKWVKLIRLITFSTIIFLVFSCSQSPNYEASQAIYDEMAYVESESVAPSEYSTVDLVSSSAARENATDTSRRFIRIAELRFKTKDAIRATYAIEDIIARHGGFVENTELRSVINRIETIRVSRDSTLESTYYTISNTMKLRVPFRKLDATLKEIAAYAEFMDYRKVSATDVRLNLFRNDLTQRRIARQEKRLQNAIDNKGERLNQITAAEDLLAARQKQADQAQLANLELKDRIEFSAIAVDLWQDGTVKRIMKANEEKIDKYRPTFGVRFSDALKAGWYGFVEFVIFLTNFWILWLMVAGVFVGIRHYRRRKKK